MFANEVPRVRPGTSVVEHQPFNRCIVTVVVRATAWQEVQPRRVQVRVQARVRVPLQRPGVVLRRTDDGRGIPKENQRTAE